MDTKALTAIVVGIAAYIAADSLIATSITGTEVGAVLIRTLVRIGIAIAIVVGVFKYM